MKNEDLNNFDCAISLVVQLYVPYSGGKIKHKAILPK